LSISRQQITEDEGIVLDGFAEGEADGARKDGAVENESVEFAVLAAGVDTGREIGEEGFVKFATGETGIEKFGVDADGDGAEVQGVEFADEFAGVALPDGEDGLHGNAREIFFTVEAEIFEEDVAERDAADSLFEKIK
jgi:hypothetical protein